MEYFDTIRSIPLAEQLLVIMTPLLAVIAAIVGIIGNTWNAKGRNLCSRLTVTGKIAAILAIASLLLSIASINGFYAKEQQRLTRKEIALLKSRRVIDNLIAPIEIMYIEFVGKTPLDENGPLFTRNFKILSSNDLYEAITRIQITNPFTRSEQWNTWSDYLQFAGIRATNMIDRYIKTYSEWLPTSILIKLESIRDHTFMYYLRETKGYEIHWLAHYNNIPVDKGLGSENLYGQIVKLKSEKLSIDRLLNPRGAIRDFIVRIDDLSIALDREFQLLPRNLEAFESIHISGVGFYLSEY